MYVTPILSSFCFILRAALHTNVPFFFFHLAWAENHKYVIVGNYSDSNEPLYITLPEQKHQAMAKSTKFLWGHYQGNENRSTDMYRNLVKRYSKSSGRVALITWSMSTGRTFYFARQICLANDLAKYFFIYMICFCWLLFIFFARHKCLAKYFSVKICMPINMRFF